MTAPRLVRPPAFVAGRVLAVLVALAFGVALFAGFRLAGADLSQAAGMAASLVVGGGLLVALLVPRRR